ncbi:MAG: hypothetical protein IPM45_11155 [Acidimicrobiales bacterium]|nr:hypothetical protein [Acidimicrobiales bacterium]
MLRTLAVAPGPAEVVLGEHLARLTAGAEGRVLVLGGGLAVAAVERLVRVPAVRAVDVLVATPVDERLLVAPDGEVPVRAWGQGQVDTVISAFGLAAASDAVALLATVTPLLAAGGRVRFLEPAPARGLAGRLERALAPVWTAVGPRRPTGAPWRPGIDVPAAIRRAGLTITDIERFTMPTLVVPLRHVALGVARRTPTGRTR